MRSDEVAAGYDVVARDYARLLPDLSFEAPLDLAVLDHVVGDLSDGATVLDAGCGAGRLARHLAARGFAVTGVDVSPEMIRAASRHQPDSRFDVADLGKLPHPDASFEAVIAWYSLIHTPHDDLASVLAELSRVLVPGGRLLLAVHAGAGVRRLSSAYGHRVALDVVRHDPTGLGNVVAAVGLTIEVRLERAPRATESSAQAFVVARR